MDKMREALMGAFTFCEEGLCKDYPATAESHIRGLAILAGGAMGRITELEAAVARLVRAGTQMSNACYNMAQWTTLPDGLKSLQERWDAAVRETPVRQEIGRLRGDGDHWARKNPGLADQYRAAMLSAAPAQEQE